MMMLLLACLVATSTTVTGIVDGGAGLELGGS